MIWRLIRLCWRIHLAWAILLSPWDDIKNIRYDMAVGEARRLAEKHYVPK